MRLTTTDGVAEIVLDDPPVNVISAVVVRELATVLDGLRVDASTRVIVFSSANPGFFLAHVDLRLAEQLEVLRELAADAPEGTNVFQALGERIRHQPRVTIVELAGKARGGGAEFVAAADLAFAARESAGIDQVESLMGIVPSGGGTRYLLERVGRHRALEIVLTGELLDAETAAAYGWINRAVPAAQQIMSAALRNGAQTPDGEADLEPLLRALAPGGR
ncbi:enoyl-CoA hydratase/isomerase family protein [Kineococcus gypseus]|uniref:enoyl-CoA hydratase/isomerase family protein n=1 Tax=Kineococcus gypseus TaxID=1637102 RepID=UPI003D7D7E2E